MCDFCCKFAANLVRVLFEKMKTGNRAAKKKAPTTCVSASALPLGLEPRTP